MFDERSLRPLLETLISLSALNLDANLAPSWSSPSMFYQLADCPGHVLDLTPVRLTVCHTTYSQSFGLCVVEL